MVAGKISKLSEVYKNNIRILIFGEPKAGKTSLVKTLADVKVGDGSNVLYFAADPGGIVLRDYPNIDCIRANYPEMLSDVYRLVKEDCAKPDGDRKWKYIVVDGLDEIGEQILAIAKKNNKDPRHAYGEMRDKVKAWIIAMCDLPTTMIFITHIEDAGQDHPIRFRPSFPGKALSGENLVQIFDGVFCLRMTNTMADGGGYVRIIQCKREYDSRFMVGVREGRVGDVPNTVELPNNISASNGSTGIGKILELVLRTRGE
jgi:hypothetical protein